MTRNGHSLLQFPSDNSGFGDLIGALSIYNQELPV